MSERIQQFKSSIEALGHQIPARFCAPWRSMTFYLHRAIGVVGGGGLGIWYSLHEARIHGIDWIGVTAALFTYFPAIVATALLDIQQDERVYWKSFGLFCTVPFGILFYLSVTGDVTGYRFVWALLGSFLAIAFWCIANGDKECFRDLRPDAPTPPPSTPTAGDSTGWKTS